MKKIILLLFVLFIFSFNSQAQQRPQYSQYMLNQYLINPAVAGTSDHYDFRAGFRDQWAGFNDAPKTFYATAHAHLGQHIGPYRGKTINEPTRHHGIGAMVMNDVTGPTSRTSAYVTYAYNLKMAKDFRLSIGASLGMQQYKLDGSKLKWADDATNNPYANGLNKTVPDGSLGAWGYGKRYYFGASIQQIIPSSFYKNVDLNGIVVDNPVRLKSHYFVTAGLKLRANDDIEILPSFLVKALPSVPVTLDLNAKVRFRNIVWAGLSYRTQDAFVFLAGVNIKNMFEIGYSYDYNTSYVSTYTGGSHEVMIAYKFLRKGGATSPSDFW